MVVTDLDHMGLQSLIERWADEESADRRLLVILENKLSKARVVKSKDIPSHTVTMNSKVRLKKKMTGGRLVCTLVYPEEAGRRRRNLSVLSDIGMAVLGQSVGDSVEGTSGAEVFLIEAVLFQPEATALNI